jgi:hypothetical protein
MCREEGGDGVAEIPIQPKRGGGIWPWVIGAVVVLLLLWYLLNRRADSDDVTPAAGDTTKTTSIMSTPALANAHFVTNTSRRS